MADRMPTKFPNNRDVITLIDEPNFWLGRLHVMPSCREIVTPSGSEFVEPRVLQVLICLTKAQGQVLCRDELIARCWQRRIVSEDAIHRCIAKVRRIADLSETPSFTLETIARVGYRLTATQPASRALQHKSEIVDLIDAITPDKSVAELAAIRDRLHALIG